MNSVRHNRNMGNLRDSWFGSSIHCHSTLLPHVLCQPSLQNKETLCQSARVASRCIYNGPLQHLTVIAVSYLTWHYDITTLWMAQELPQYHVTLIANLLLCCSRFAPLLLWTPSTIFLFFYISVRGAIAVSRLKPLIKCRILIFLWWRSPRTLQILLSKRIYGAKFIPVTHQWWHFS